MRVPNLALRIIIRLLRATVARCFAFYETPLSRGRGTTKLFARQQSDSSLGFAAMSSTDSSLEESRNGRWIINVAGSEMIRSDKRDCILPNLPSPATLRCVSSLAAGDLCRRSGTQGASSWNEIIFHGYCIPFGAGRVKYLGFALLNVEISSLAPGWLNSVLLPQFSRSFLPFVSARVFRQLFATVSSAV